MGLRCSSLKTFCIASVIGGLLIGPVHASDLYEAAKAKDVKRVMLLLKSGADPNLRSPYDGPLHVAARLGQIEMVKGLLKAGADVELAGYGGVRPLHAAALAGREAVIVILLESGAKVDSLDNVGRTPLLSLVSGAVQGVSTLKILLEAGADPNLLDGAARFHALDHAAIQGRADTAEILLAFGADADAKDSLYAKTPLHYAIAYCLNAASGHSEVVRILIAYGADVNATDADHLTPMEYAKRYAPNNGLIHHMLSKAGAK